MASNRTIHASRVVVRDFGGSLQCDGVASKVSVTANAVCNNLTQVSVAFWMRPSGGGGGGIGRIFHKGPNSVGYLDILFPTTGRLTFNADWLTTDETALLNTGLITGKWYFVVITYSGLVGDAPIFYINGNVAASAATATSSGARAADSTNLTIGNWVTNTSRAYSGMVCNIALFNTILSASQVWQYYSTGAEPVLPVGRWRCDDATGSALADSTGNGSDGAISSAVFATNVPMKKRAVVANHARLLATQRTAL